jgi:hypothetical protein
MLPPESLVDLGSDFWTAGMCKAGAACLQGLAGAVSGSIRALEAVSKCPENQGKVPPGGE